MTVIEICIEDVCLLKRFSGKELIYNR